MPTDLQSYETDQNPFADILASAQGTPGVNRNPAGPQAEEMPVGGPEGTPQPGMEQAPPNPQIEEGVNPDPSQAILGAMQQMEKFITQSTNPESIKRARALIHMMSQMVSEAQNELSEQL